jgi:hypothetical protein
MKSRPVSPRVDTEQVVVGMDVAELIGKLAVPQDIATADGADEQVIRTFAQACEHADNDPRERRRVREIAGIIDAEDALYARALDAVEHGDRAGALELLGQCARAGIGESAWMLAELQSPPRAAARPSRGLRRLRSGPARGGAALLMAAAAAAVITASVSVGGSLPTPAQHLTHVPTIQPRPAPAAVQATGAVSEPRLGPGGHARTGAPFPRVAPRTTAELCRAYFSYYEHPGPKSKWAADFALFGRLSILAGGPLKVVTFCQPYIRDLFPNGFTSAFPGDSPADRTAVGNG